MTWDLSNASYTNNSLALDGYDYNNTDVFVSSDGSKLFVLGRGEDYIWRYSMGTPYDLSTATIDSGKEFYVGDQDGYPHGMYIRSNGLKLYVVGTGSGGEVFEYTMSSAWDVSTASYEWPNGHFDPTSQESYPTAVYLSDDGSKVYVAGINTNSIYQYTLSTPWDLSTASYASKSLSCSSQCSDIRGMFFDSAGEKISVSDAGSDTIYQYNLGTAWDLSTGSYASISFSVASEDSNPTGVCFGNSDKVMYVIGANNYKAFEYNTSTDVSVVCPIFSTTTIGRSSAQEQVPMSLFGIDTTLTVGSIFEGTSVITDTFSTTTNLEGQVQINLACPTFSLSTTLGIIIGHVLDVPTFSVTTEIGTPEFDMFDLKNTDILYFFTLTGDADGTTDIELPISNFQCRMRVDEPTFLAVTIPSSVYADEVSARPNGTMNIDLAYKRDGEILQRGTIASADLEIILYWEGGRNNAIVLNGHKTETFANRSLTIDKSVYRLVNNGKFRHRLASPNIYIKPGDTVTIEGDTFKANVITYYVSPNSQTMEIAED